MTVELAVETYCSQELLHTTIYPEAGNLNGHSQHFKRRKNTVPGTWY